jgi:uncharacterized protein
MDRRIIFFLITTCVALLLEVYTYYALRSTISSPRVKTIFNWVYLAQTLFLVFSMYKIYQGMASGSVFRSTATNLYIGIVFSSIVGKLILCLGMLLQDSGRVLVGSFNFLAAKISKTQVDQYVPDRRKFLTTAAIATAAVPFLGMLYGITKGKYQYTIERISLAFGNLPKAFNGLKVVQISDIHSGSFDSKESVMKGINMINDLEPDLILFTGDLVNSQSKEIDPYIDVFGQLKAKYGKYAILGNHDYYGIPREGNQEAYIKDFHSKYGKMGFKLLKNENASVEIGGEMIFLLGVENWGAGRFFQKYGDIDATLKGVKEEDFVILMSHDPTHWSEKVLDHPRQIPITLSGHTHGMQFGIDIPGFKWSPVKYRYKHWSGLYEDRGQYLYVNRGFGFLGFPGRVGMWPEITLLELKSTAV